MILRTVDDFTMGCCLDEAFDGDDAHEAWEERHLRRVVEAGALELQLGASSEDLRLRADVRLVGPDRVVGADRVLSTSVVVEEAAS